jgi:MioC protein
MQLHILVATMSGTAESVAQALQLACSDAFDPIHIHRMETVDAGIFDEDAVFLICSSTYGSGDVPDNGQALYVQLDAEPRYLGHVRYGLVALGDSSYGDTYGMGGLQFDARLQDLGAQRIGDICRLDASSGEVPEDEALAWCETWRTQAPATS